MSLWFIYYHKHLLEISILIEIFVHICIEIKFGFNLERDKIAKLLQKLEQNWDKN